MSSIGITRPARGAGALALTFLAIELVDELVDGAASAAWPAIRADLALDYAQVGMLLTIPALVGNILEPPLWILGDVSGARRRLILGGGLFFLLALLLLAASWSFVALLVALLAFSPSSGAFVGLAQATYMDLDPRRHAQNMARWTLAGSLGGVGGAALVAATSGLGFSWRVAMLAIGAITAVTLLAFVRSADSMPRSAASAPTDAREGLRALGAGARAALRSLRQWSVARWVVLLQCSDLMLDILRGYLALYFVDVVGVGMSEAALGVATWIGVGLIGDALVIPLLERVHGVRYLRVSAALTALAYVGLLLVPGFAPKVVLAGVLGLLNSGWYAILQAELYSTMPGRSATALAIGNVGGMVGGLFPLIMGLVAARAGLDAAMWMLLVGPCGLMIGLPRSGENAETASEVSDEP